MPPQFKGKTKEKKRQISHAKLEIDEEGGMMGEETEEEKKKERCLPEPRNTMTNVMVSW